VFPSLFSGNFLSIHIYYSTGITISGEGISEESENISRSKIGGAADRRLFVGFPGIKSDFFTDNRVDFLSGSLGEENKFGFPQIILKILASLGGSLAGFS